MTYRLVEIPSQPAHLAFWLERELVGDGLARLTRELSLVHDIPVRIASASEVDEWLGGDAFEVAERGLRGLSPERVRSLLETPALLPGLQEYVLMHGGAYWQTCCENAAREVSSVDSGALPAAPVVERRPGQSSRIRYYGALSAAASAALALALWWSLTGGTANWGWNTPGLTARADLSAPQYLNLLADSANQWFLIRPNSRVELQRRIQELQTGCLQLIDGQHPALQEADRRLLIRRCETWRSRIDRQAQLLAAGEEFGKIQRQMDDLVREAVEKLQEQAGVAQSS